MKLNQNPASKTASFPIVLGAALFLTGMATSAQAQTQQAKATPVAQVNRPATQPASRTQIVLGNEVVMRLVDEGGKTAEERTRIIYERLIPIMALDGLSAEDVTLRAGPDRSFTSIYVRDHLLATVSWGLARANNTTPDALANIYAERFRRILPQVAGSEYSPFNDFAGRGPM